MRIPFDISKRPQIESGEYKVVYVEYPSTNQYPVEILKWDSNSDAGCIIGCIRRNGKDRIYAFDENGEHKVSGEDDRLFIVIPEPEISEFEKRLQEVLFEHATTNSSAEEKAHQYSAELLSLAKQQLLQSGELLTQEHHEKLMETLHKECTKDLPRWKKASGKERFSERMLVLAGDNDLCCTNYAEEGEYYLPFPILVKLPKEESHEQSK